MNIMIFSEVLASMIRIATPLALMALGGLLCQRAGVFNIALEGFALIGAFAAIAFVHFSGGSVWIGMLGAMVFGAIFSAIFALFVTRFKANHIIASIAMNMLALGLTAFLLRVLFDVQGRFAPPDINRIRPITIPLIGEIPILRALSGQNIITYLVIILTVAFYVMLFKTKSGLNICAVGESVDAAKTAGIKPDLVRWKVILISGALSGLAGAYLSTVIVSQFSENMVQGRGFTAFTAVVFGGSHPIYTVLVTLMFGISDAIGIQIELAGLNVSPSIIRMFPYVLAVVALTVSSYTIKRRMKGITSTKRKRSKVA